MKPHLNLLYIGNNPNYFNNIKDNETISLTIMENSIKAIQHLTSHEVTDAIICDYNLSGNNGLYLYDWIRERAEFNTIPFIILTKEFNIETYKNAFIKGVSDYYILAVTPVTVILERIAFLRTHQNIAINTTQLNQKDTEQGYKMPISKRVFDIFVAS
jgi:CheY-like chemotaxis protein